MEQSLTVRHICREKSDRLPYSDPSLELMGPYLMTTTLEAGGRNVCAELQIRYRVP